MDQELSFAACPVVPRARQFMRKRIPARRQICSCSMPAAAVSSVQGAGLCEPGCSLLVSMRLLRQLHPARYTSATAALYGSECVRRQLHPVRAHVRDQAVTCACQRH